MPFTILYWHNFILNIAIVTNLVHLLERSPIMTEFWSLFLPSCYSRNYAGKIGASLIEKKNRKGKGKYMKLAEEDKALIGKYASKHGMAKAEDSDH